ncbi:hypothetical protein J2Z48_000988 [Croceifilum oryzae]|uniref:Uncharacterized protein n=1 Tax=Croceifilum oryzae TaxID=1553429 RepID=A0AAJ1WTA9_9BACL|nr:lipoprotein BA_5634 family protein [Croceifilum oryzae]MDQ0416816.1 hypothetical protein [Croceifilum oryzae]
MKKIVTIGSITVVAAILLTYFFFKPELLHYFGRPNGAIVLGEKEEVQKTLSDVKSKISAQENYTLKESKINDKKVLFLSKTTAEALNKRGLMNTVKRVKGPKGLEIEKLITLPAVPTGKGILFAREDLKEGATKSVESEQKLITEYKGDTIIGEGSRFPGENSYVMVSDDIFASIKAPEKQLTVLLADVENGKSLIKLSDTIDYINASLKPWK